MEVMKTRVRMEMKDMSNFVGTDLVYPPPPWPGQCAGSWVAGRRPDPEVPSAGARSGSQRRAELMKSSRGGFCGAAAG